MFARASYRSASRTFSSVKAHSVPKSRAAQLALASSTFAGLSLYFLSQKPIYNDASNGVASPLAKPQAVDKTGLSPLVWGSNQNHLISLERESNEYIKFPTPAPDLFSTALRDLAFCPRHAVCVDAAGDVYQWGDGFFGTAFVENRQPRLTLSGKNIISVEATPSKIFALSSSGKIYVISSKFKSQEGTTSQNAGWKIFGRSESDPSAFKVLNTDVALRFGERFTSIAAGSDHLIALTSNGRTFTHPVTRLANWFGQLGMRKISVPDSADSKKRIPLSLTPRSLRDTSQNDVNMAHPDIYTGQIEAFPTGISDDKTIGFCDRLFEVPALRGVEVQQIAAGDRTSFVLTRHGGRVLAWGANEYGQLGLGANLTIPVIAVPTEVVFSRSTNRMTLNRCVSVAAGGDLTCFTVERMLHGSGPSVVDVLACGNGQWGGLGNGSFSNAQGTPAKVKNISGILEYDDDTQSLKPLRPHHISIAPGPPSNPTKLLPSSSGHIIATLDTLTLSHPDPKSDVAADAALASGRDVLTWGLNQQYQLGNGRRSSVNVPASVPSPGDDIGRMMCRAMRERVVNLAGGVVGRNMRVEQRAIAGPGLSVVYWKVL